MDSDISSLPPFDFKEDDDVEEVIYKGFDDAAFYNNTFSNKPQLSINEKRENWEAVQPLFRSSPALPSAPEGYYYNKCDYNVETTYEPSGGRGMQQMHFTFQLVKTETLKRKRASTTKPRAFHDGFLKVKLDQAKLDEIQKGNEMLSAKIEDDNRKRVTRVKKEEEEKMIEKLERREKAINQQKKSHDEVLKKAREMKEDNLRREKQGL